jgi:pimeloyl-ACP methyl ester carboxylesterase
MWCHVADLPVYYEQVGDGRPVLFLHGWTLDHRYEVTDFEPIFRQREGWQRVYLDLPGMGQTPARDWIANQDHILRVVLAFIDHVFAGGRFTVVGTSAGAYLARGVVYHKAAVLDGVLLRVPLIVADDAKRTLPSPAPLIRDPELIATLDPTGVDALSEVLVQRAGYIAALRDKVQTAVRPAQRLADTAFLEGIRSDPASYAFSFDVDALSQPCRAPTLILAGRQDGSVGYRDAWSIVENFPRATFAVLDRADHGLPVEQNGVFGLLVNEWLDRIEETST